jgi:phosphocarrier protein
MEAVAEREVTVPNRLGLHARAAAKFVHLASRFQSRILLYRDDHSVDGKSLLGLLTLAAAQGTCLRIVAEGADSEAAVEALSDLVQARFGEDG